MNLASPPRLGGDRFASPLRYPGGKGKVANYLKLLILENDLSGCLYVEPFAGGAGAALALLYEEYVERIHINDINRGVAAFWVIALGHGEVLRRRVSKARLNMDEWERQRLVQRARDPDPLDLAFSTFFLNRVNRSGIVDGGVIGGRGQSGTWKLDARFNKQTLLRRLEKVERYSGRITFTAMDAAELLARISPVLPRDSLVYLDPPYYVKGKGLYENWYDDDDHRAIRSLVRAIKTHWLVSYDAADYILALYAGVRSLRYSLSYSAGDRYRGSEVIFYSPDLKIPTVASPANVSAGVVGKMALGGCGSR